ncbi:TatD family hydrolase [Synechococcus sp. CS-1324]|uniref:TatD family hydrolase n=1 Tax=unclassified Synechococcus TaxID=2626047 RepID=UPI000DAF55A5|nr:MULTISPECIES: TatD family hydrolase [unclassified Synechococcus]MCT0213403.1 TatD family hydrolase [Synechococcus sp. CS-1326]MCT0231641.1 TatD family hydrolase [Synechococcus sp. CS-1324]MCT0232743.1 TatD family hydrolase [Synechococcus sp. CS-1327]PZV03603.1 MAG: deoxyribonuclease [Cyanobium sp.]
MAAPSSPAQPTGAELAPLPALIDSHCHVVFRNFEADLDQVALRWRQAGVVSLLHSCVEPGEIPAIRALADRFPELRYSVGVHPLDPQHWQADTPAVLREAARQDSRVVAIGELGLDLFKAANLEEQRAMLLPQLALAVELGLPVIIHCRDAAQPMLETLRQLQAEGHCPRGVMHCWGGTPEQMTAFLDLGFLISFSGTVTFASAADTHACARLVPADRYLIETDCPFLAPVPRRGKRNEPAFVLAVAERLAALRGETLSQVAAASTANAVRLFGLPNQLGDQCV